MIAVGAVGRRCRVSAVATLVWLEDRGWLAVIFLAAAVIYTAVLIAEVTR